jgi:signal transduction histidine kinase
MPGILVELVQACSRTDPVSGDFAPFFLHDPTLALRLLASAPLPAPTPQSSPELIRPALNCHSISQIRALALSVLPPSPELLPSLQECWLRSLKVALLARQLAEKTGACPAEWAWLAGLFHNLGEGLRIQGLGEEMAGVELERLDACGFIADAVRHCRVPLPRVKTAHPLVKIIHAAYALSSRDLGANSMEGRGALAGMDVEGNEAATLVSSAHAQLGQIVARYGMGEPNTGNLHSTDGGSLAQLIHAYSKFAAAGVFQEALPPTFTAESLGRVLIELLPLVFGVSDVILFVLHHEDGSLRLLSDDSQPQGLRELTFKLGDPMGCLTLASQGKPVRWSRDEADRHAVLDEQIARLLRAHTVFYQPLGGQRGVAAILAVANPARRMEEEPSWQTLVAKLNAGFGAREAPEPAILQVAYPQDVIPRDQVRRAVHEVANPLTIMRNYVNLLSSKLESDVASQRDLKIISDEIERAARILRELTRAQVDKDFVIPDEETNSVAVNPVISELVRMSLGTLFVPNRISVQIDLDPDIPQIRTSRDKLKQVLLNLAKNAVEAMPRGGRLIIATRIRTDLMPPRLEISMRDNGPGLPDSVLERLFEPVASTKGGDHSGLGLSISSNLVKSLGGEIECDTGQNGTEFRVRLPVASVARTNIKMSG